MPRRKGAQSSRRRPRDTTSKLICFFLAALLLRAFACPFLILASNSHKFLPQQVHRSLSIQKLSGKNSSDRSEGQSSEESDSRLDELPILFPRRVIAADTTLLADDIIPPGVLLEFVSADILNAFINYVSLRAVITERDPEEDERYINQSNRFYTHFHEFGTAIHVVASSERYWWYFWYDIDASDCAIGRVEQEEFSLPEVVRWVYGRRVSGRYPTVEIDVRLLQGWRSFQ